MGGGLVQGAALGTAFDQLFKSAVDATQKVARFSSDLNRLNSTLSLIKPAVDDIDSFNKILERPQHETEAFTLRLMEGQKLISKCSKVKWNIFMRFYYSNKLSKLETSLVKFFQIDVAALHFREAKRLSVSVSNLEEKMNEIITMLKTSRNASSETVVGFEQSWEETVHTEEDGTVVQHAAVGTDCPGD